MHKMYDINYIKLCYPNYDIYNHDMNLLDWELDIIPCNNSHKSI